MNVYLSNESNIVVQDKAGRFWRVILVTKHDPDGNAISLRLIKGRTPFCNINPRWDKRYLVGTNKFYLKSYKDDRDPLKATEVMETIKRYEWMLVNPFSSIKEPTDDIAVVVPFVKLSP